MNQVFAAIKGLSRFAVDSLLRIALSVITKADLEVFPFDFVFSNVIARASDVHLLQTFREKVLEKFGLNLEGDVPAFQEQQKGKPSLFVWSYEDYKYRDWIDGCCLSVVLKPEPIPRSQIITFE